MIFVLIFLSHSCRNASQFGTHFHIRNNFSMFSLLFIFRPGYKPSHAEKLNDRYMKNAAAEIHKLRKEKQQIKLSSMPGTGLKVTQSNSGKKTDKLKDVLVEIEKVNFSNLKF